MGKIQKGLLFILNYFTLDEYLEFRAHFFYNVLLQSTAITSTF